MEKGWEELLLELKATIKDKIGFLEGERLDEAVQCLDKELELIKKILSLKSDAAGLIALCYRGKEFGP